MLAFACVAGSHEDAWRVVSCLFAGVVTSFECVRFFDRSAFGRLAHKHGWSMPQFYFGNFFLHHLPFLFVTIFCPVEDLRLWHGAMAMTMHVAWGAVASWAHGAALLDVSALYVDLPVRVWRRLFWIAFFAEVGFPFLLLSWPLSRP